jgi:CBS domain containing-hemolysin-like protein
MMWLAGLVVGLVFLGSVLALAESSISRMSRVRAVSLRQRGRRNAALLEQIERNPARYLNAVYLSVVFVQNGSAVLVAFLAERRFGELGITVVSVVFTLVYFVVVEAMSKTYAVLNSDRVALALAPLVWVIGRSLAIPARLLIGLANVLLPGSGLKEGPFVSEEDIRSMADVGHEEGAIEEGEKEMIHSIFEFGGTLVREVMVPRPDVVAVHANTSIRSAVEQTITHGLSRLPVHRGGLDDIEGVVHIRDLLKALHEGRTDARLPDLARPAHFVPETKKAVEVLREMQRQKFHMAIVTNEYGAVAGIVTLENLLEELVGDIAEEHEHEVRDIETLGDGRYRVDASVTVHELDELLGTTMPQQGWNTIGGLMFGLIGAIPAEGQSVTIDGYRLTAERVKGRRVTRVLVSRE